MKIEKIIIRGRKGSPLDAVATRGGEKPFEPENSSLQLEAVYDLSSDSRGASEEHEIDVQDKVLEFVYEDDTAWLCDAKTLHELYPEAENPQRGSAGFVVPSIIKSNAAERGIGGEVAAKLLKVFAKPAIEMGVKAIAAKLEKTHLADREGLNYLNKKFELLPFDGSASDKTFLLFIHGTNSDTRGAFMGLQNSETWDYICENYGKNVLAFEHRTLTQSPLQNALDLVTKLPDRAVLHVISHSRGGLIGDILCRYTRDEQDNLTGFSSYNMELLAKETRNDGLLNALSPGEKELNRATDIECIKAINLVYTTKKITVKKFIRVACPAAGTKLASSRLDQLLNVLYNCLGGRLSETATVLKELIAVTLKTKNDVHVLPGIEAMGPQSTFIKVLNDRSDDTVISGRSLAVISGNGKLSISLKGLWVIVGKLFYGQRNDLVVNTDSMYLGTTRKGPIQYYFNEGKTVDHITYFENDKTCAAVAAALKTADGDAIPGFTVVPQNLIPASDRGMVRGFEHGELSPYPGIPTGNKPIVVLLPGIMGSNLSGKEGKIWIDYLKSIFGGLKDLEFNADANISATSIIQTSYKNLADRLSPNYDVLVYPFDWRRQLNDCAKDFNDTIIKLLSLNKPIKIIGHSMGGVLVRDFIVNHDDTWQKLNASKDFRLLFLGSPLGGSFRIPAVLFGNDPIINSLNMLDRRHTKKELVGMFIKFPGILSLLPTTTGTNDSGESNDFAALTTWEKMREAAGDSSWPLPSAFDLQVFKTYRDGINSKMAAIDYSNMVYIAGKDKSTVCGYYNDTIPPRTELVFLSTGEGDQSVTWESGIPVAMVKSNRVYYSDTTHGALANDSSIFGGIEEILEKGFTTRLSNTRPLVRGEEKVFRTPEVYNFDLSERGLENAVFGITEKNEQLVNQMPLSVSISHGDLAYASFPVLAGHFMNDGILYAEKSIDYLMNNSLSARHAIGIYPGEIGTSAAMATNRDESDFPGALVVGLGEPGTLTSFLLTQTVEQAISKYLLDMNNQTDNGADIGISSLIIGCGYGGLSVETSIKAIIEGVNNANSKLSDLYMSNLYKTPIRLIQHIEFIELYKDKVLNGMYALRKIESKENNQYNIRIGNKAIKLLFGSRRRLATEAPEEWWRRITVKYNEVKKGSKELPSLVFGSSTGDAREEERELYSSTSLIDLFVEQISAKNSWSTSIAKTLFELMIPNEFKDRLKKKGSITWILEKQTAAYPWELLQDNTPNAKPLCVNAGMIRQLSTKDFRVNIKRVAGDKALVIGDPDLKDFAGVSQLPGAKREGELVSQLLSANNYEQKTLINENAAEILVNLLSDEYKIVHLAGHGFFNPEDPKQSGMVIGKNMFLTPFDIEQMNTVPELVFINCCHLGKVDPEWEKNFMNKYKLAANLGTQLIQMGVKAVIAAGWAVHDGAAHDFATEFYTKMFAGCTFGDAVKDARGVVYEKYHHGNNTWGAYQCYGDPFYKLINRTSGKVGSATQYVMAEQVLIELDNLRNDVDTRNYSCKAIIEKIKNIKAAASQAGIYDTGIVESEALIYYELGDYERSVAAYEKLKKSQNASFSVSALEKYCNARCKMYVESYAKGYDAQKAVEAMYKIIGELDKLIEIEETDERTNLVGSAWRRIALLSEDRHKKLEAYENAATAYDKANSKKKTGDAENGVDEKPEDRYALKSKLFMQLVYDFANGSVGSSVKLSDENRKEAIEKLKTHKEFLNPRYRNMDYWELIEAASIDFLLLALENDQALVDDNWVNLEKKYQRIWKKAGSKGKIKAEMENFAIIADGLSISTDPHALYLKNKVQELKDKLVKYVED